MKRKNFLGVMSMVFLITFTSCTKDQDKDNVAIPNVPVNERININDPLYNNLANVGGWAYLNAGSMGIILYRESTERVRAYERHCTYDPSQTCSQVDMNTALLQANDYDCCGSIFSISSNSIIQGPATVPLLEYATDFDGTFVEVTN